MRYINSVSLVKTHIRFLSSRYIVLGDDVERTCRYNASVALNAGYKEIAKAWAMAAARFVPPL